MKFFIKLCLIAALCSNVFSDEYTSAEAKNIFTTFDTTMSLNCSGKNCDFDLSYVYCNSINALNAVSCNALREYEEKTQIITIHDSSAKTVLNLLKDLNVGERCFELMGVEHCSVSKVKCSKRTKLFISKYECLLE